MNVDDGYSLFELQLRDAWLPVFEMNEDNCFACSDENCPCTSVHVNAKLKAPHAETHNVGDRTAWIVVDYRRSNGGFETFAIITHLEKEEEEEDEEVSIDLGSRFVNMPYHS